MHWYPVTGFLLLICLLTHSEVHGQANSSVRYTIVIHERASEGELNDAEPGSSVLAHDTDADLYSHDMDTDSASPEIKMYKGVAEEAEPLPGVDLPAADISLAGLQQYLDPEKGSSSISSETPEDAANVMERAADGKDAYRIVMEYN